jgi:hypothetical protein
LNKSNIIHKNEIIKQNNLKNAHIYCKINNLSGSTSGFFIEYYIKNKYHFIKNNPSSCIGDLKINDKNIEIKTSFGCINNNLFNYVQLRTNHECNYILCAYYLNESNIDNFGELFIFDLCKNDIKQLILKFGNYAHGTKSRLGQISKKDLDDINNNKEYALRVKYNSIIWIKLLDYRIDKINI